VEVDSPGFWVTRLRNGKIVHMRFYTDEAAAVEGVR
jgi:ketosteroid isomerase-like protein